MKATGNKKRTLDQITKLPESVEADQGKQMKLEESKETYAKPEQRSALHKWTYDEESKKEIDSKKFAFM